MTKVYNFIKLMRLHQIIKNILIFAPLFFAGQILDIYLLKQAFLAFIAFSCVTSAVYIFNDMQDIAEDLMHPIKKNRPLAAGLISLSAATSIMMILSLTGVVVFYINSIQALQIVLSYLMMNIAYSLFLKKIAILDVSIIAIGFVLRLLIGSVVTGVSLSM